MGNFEFRSPQVHKNFDIQVTVWVGIVPPPVMCSLGDFTPRKFWHGNLKMIASKRGAPPGFMFWPLRRINWDYRLLSMYRMLGRVETLVAKLRPGEKAHSGHVTLKTSRRMFAVKPPSKQSPQKVLGFWPSRQGWTQRYKRWAPQSYLSTRT